MSYIANRPPTDVAVGQEKYPLGSSLSYQVKQWYRWKLYYHLLPATVYYKIKHSQYNNNLKGYKLDTKCKFIVMNDREERNHGHKLTGALCCPLVVSSAAYAWMMCCWKLDNIHTTNHIWFIFPNVELGILPDTILNFLTLAIALSTCTLCLAIFFVIWTSGTGIWRFDFANWRNV